MVPWVAVRMVPPRITTSLRMGCGGAAGPCVLRSAETMALAIGCWSGCCPACCDAVCCVTAVALSSAQASAATARLAQIADDICGAPYEVNKSDELYRQAREGANCRYGE